MLRTLVLLGNYLHNPTELSSLHTATLASCIHALQPGLRVHSRLVNHQDATQMRMAYSVFGENPEMVGFYADDLWDPNLGMLLERLRPLLPKALFFAMGPASTYSDQAVRLLHRFPQMDFAIRGAPKEVLLTLCAHWANQSVQGEKASLPQSPPPGLTLWRGDDIVESGPPRPVGELQELPSPYLTRHLEVGSQTPCTIELGRLSEDGRFMPFPMERIKGELAHLLANLEVPSLRLEPTPCDSDPFFFKRVLNEISRCNRRTRIEVTLEKSPAGPLLEAMTQAGVGLVNLEAHSLPGQDVHLADKAPRLKSHLQRIKTHGIHTKVYVEIGRPSDNANRLEGLINRVITAGVEGFDVSAVKVPKRSDLNAWKSPVLSDGNRGEILAHEDLPFMKAGSLLVRGQCLAAYMPPFSGTLRCLLRISNITALQLANELRARNLPGSNSQEDCIAQRHMELAQFVEHYLKQNNRLDRLPVFTALLKFERWVAESSRPFTREAPVPYDDKTFELVIPTVSRAVRVKSFAYDVLALVRGSTIEDVPVSKSHVLVWNGGHGASKVYQLSDLQRKAMSLVDGVRPIEQLAHLLGEQCVNEQYDVMALVGVFQHLIAMGALFAAGTTDAPPHGRRNNNVLLFKRRSGQQT